MNWFDMIERYYELKIYSDEDIKIFVQAGRITEDEFKKITGSEYTE